MRACIFCVRFACYICVPVVCACSRAISHNATWQVTRMQAVFQPLNYRISRVAVYEAIWSFIVSMFSLLYSALMKIAFSQSYTPVSAPESGKRKSSPALTQSATQGKPDRPPLAKGPR